MVVRDGAPKPNIESVEALKQTLLHARSIAYSDSASGVYIERELFKRLGIEDQVKSKAKMIPRIPVASVVAAGDYLASPTVQPEVMDHHQPNRQHREEGTRVTF